MASVKLEKIVEKMKLENLTPELDISKIKIKQPDINRPALQMAGYFEHFEDTRLQIIGFVEYTYMEGLPQARQKEVFTRLLSYVIPAIIFSRELQPNPLFLEIALEHKIPLFSTKKATSSFMAEIIRWLNVQLAPCISIHGVLVDVYGEGVLIMGESGIGKSEVDKAERFVADVPLELDHDALAFLVHMPLIPRVFVDEQHIVHVGHEAFAVANVSRAPGDFHGERVSRAVVSGDHAMIVFGNRVDCDDAI